MSEAARSATTAVVCLEGRGDLPFHPLHGEPLVVHALRTVRAVRRRGLLGQVVVTVDGASRGAAERVLADDAGFLLREAARWWADRDPGAGPVLLVDPLCPLAPGDLLARLAGSAPDGRARAAYRPVTDTLKTVVADRIAGTVDREGCAVVTSPVLVPAGLGGEVPTQDFAQLVAWLRRHGPVELVEAPALGRRVGDAASLLLLECTDDLAAG